LRGFLLNPDLLEQTSKIGTGDPLGHIKSGQNVLYSKQHVNDATQHLPSRALSTLLTDVAWMLKTNIEDSILAENQGSHQHAVASSIRNEDSSASLLMGLPGSTSLLSEMDLAQMSQDWETSRALQATNVMLEVRALHQLL
jgi:hypothetical protein